MKSTFKAEGRSSLCIDRVPIWLEKWVGEPDYLYVELFPSISSAQLWTYFSVLDLYLAVLALYFYAFPVFLLANLALCKNFQNSPIKQRNLLRSEGM